MGESGHNTQVIADTTHGGLRKPQDVRMVRVRASDLYTKSNVKYLFIFPAVHAPIDIARVH